MSRQFILVGIVVVVVGAWWYMNHMNNADADPPMDDTQGPTSRAPVAATCTFDILEQGSTVASPDGNGRFPRSKTWTEGTSAQSIFDLSSIGFVNNNGSPKKAEDLGVVTMNRSGDTDCELRIYQGVLPTLGGKCYVPYKIGKDDPDFLTSKGLDGNGDQKWMLSYIFGSSAAVQALAGPLSKGECTNLNFESDSTCWDGNQHDPVCCRKNGAEACDGTHAL